MFVCVYVRSYLRNPLTDLPQILIGELCRTTEMFLAKLKSQSWVPKLVNYISSLKIHITYKDTYT